MRTLFFKYKISILSIALVIGVTTVTVGVLLTINKNDTNSTSTQQDNSLIQPHSPQDVFKEGHALLMQGKTDDAIVKFEQAKLLYEAADNKAGAYDMEMNIANAKTLKMQQADEQMEQEVTPAPVLPSEQTPAR